MQTTGPGPTSLSNQEWVLPSGSLNSSLSSDPSPDRWHATSLQRPYQECALRRAAAFRTGSGKRPGHGPLGSEIILSLLGAFLNRGADCLSREASGLGRVLGTIANTCQGEFLPEATMRGLLNLYRTMQ